jgi:hypothetical protein
VITMRIAASPASIVMSFLEIPAARRNFRRCTKVGSSKHNIAMDVGLAEPCLTHTSPGRVVHVTCPSRGCTGTAPGWVLSPLGFTSSDHGGAVIEGETAG